MCDGWMVMYGDGDGVMVCRVWIKYVFRMDVLGYGDEGVDGCDGVDVGMVW